MPLKSGVLLMAALLNLSLGLIVFLRQPKRPANRTFGIFALVLSGWCLTNFLGKMGIGVKVGLLVTKFAFAFGSLVPCTFLAFALVFPKDKTNTAIRYWFVAIYLIGATFAILSFTPFILKGVALRFWGLAPIYGVGYRLLALYGLSSLSLGVAVLARKLVRSPSGYERLQLKYLFWGLGIFATATLSLSAISPLITGTNQLVYLGPLSTVPMVAFISYAIVRYRLMEIEIVFHRGLVYVGMIVILSLLFFVLDWIFSPLLAPHYVAADLLAFLLLTLLLTPLKEKIETAVGYLLPGGRRNYQEILREFSQKLTALRDLHSLQQLIVQNLFVMTQAKHVSLWLLQEGQEGCYRPVASYPDGRVEAIGIEGNHPFCWKLKEARQVLVKEELARQLEPEEFEGLEEGFAAAAASLLVPLVSRGELHGLLALGEKRSRKIYSDEEIQFLATVGHQAAIALENAALYNQILVARDHYGMLLRHLDHGVVAVDSERMITTINPKAAEILQVKQEEVMGQKACSLGEELADLLDEALNGLGYSRRELLLTLPLFSNGLSEELGQGSGIRNQGSGRPSTDSCQPIPSEGFSSLNGSEGERGAQAGSKRVFLSASGSSLRDWDGGKLGALLLLSDQTEKRRLEGEVRRAQRLASLGAMAARLAHEIRNPLVAVKTFCQLLPERYGDAEFVDSFSSLVGKEVNRINAIVEQFLDLSRRTPMTLRPIELHRILEETLALLQNEFLERGIQVVRHLHEGEISILGDEEKLKQVFLNLLLNSLQAIEGAGSITISTGVRGQPGSVELPMTRSPQPEENGNGQPSEVWVQIADTGQGIPPEHLPYLFDSFFTTKEKGSGLGLSICQNIVKELKGEIHIESEAGKGTLVSLRFPLTSFGDTLGKE